MNPNAAQTYLRTKVMTATPEQLQMFQRLKQYLGRQ